MVALSNETSIVPSQQVSLALDRVRVLAEIVRQMRGDTLKEGTDYGIIPGTGDTPTLLLPGMEKLMRALNAVPEYIERRVIVDYDRPLFHYEYECRLVDADTGLAISGGRGLGLCTSMESSFRWRWVQEYELPKDVDRATLKKSGGKTSEFAFAVEKAETTGKYGKPAEYWQIFRDAIANKTAIATTRKTQNGKEMDAWEVDTTVYRIENPNIFDQVNAIMKRAKKRALGDAIKGAANVSEYFTVDLEDLPRHAFSPGVVVEGEIVEAPPANVEPKDKPASKNKPERKPAADGKWAFTDNTVTDLMFESRDWSQPSAERMNTIQAMRKEGAFDECRSLEAALEVFQARLASPGHGKGKKADKVDLSAPPDDDPQEAK